MEHSGAERALTEKVVDSVTVGNCVLPPLLFLHFLFSERLALITQKVSLCSGIESVLRHTK